ncbi:MAG: hypothetical protein IJH07_08250 [Ruminococcus sp.]|nr:hypothetical protein [Ruminococcus sp.]
MKRILCLMLCALMMTLVCACGKDNNDNDTATPTQAEPETAAQQTQAPATPDQSGDTLGLKSFIAGFDTAPTVAETVIYEDKDFTVTVAGLDYSAISGPGLKLTVNNASAKDVIVQSPYAVVNGFMISPEISIEAAAGKTATGTLTLPYFNLAISGITSLRTIEFALRVVESNSYEPIFKTDLFSLTASSAQDPETACDESGQTAYDDNDIKIILKGVSTDRAYSDGAELMVYLYNGTDRNIAVRTGDVIVNGYDMTSAMNCTILPDKCAVDVVTFYTLDMEEFGIDEIDSVKVSFEIKDAENWETIDSTGLINVELDQAETATESESEKAE